MALPFLEPFTGAGAPLANPPWTDAALVTPHMEYTGAGTGSATGQTGVGDVLSYNNNNVYNNDQYAQVVIVSGLNSTNFSDAELVVRASGTAATFVGYRFACSDIDWEIARYAAGVPTVIASGSATFASADLIKLTAVGTLISCYRNGSLVGSVTDANIASGSAGCGVFNANVNQIILDDFEGGNVSAGGGTPVLSDIPHSRQWQAVIAQ